MALTEMWTQVFWRALLEATPSRRQLRAAETGSLARESSGGCQGLQIETSARARGMEALDEPQQRAKAKLRKATRTGVSVPPNVTPGIQTRSVGIGDASGGTFLAPYPGRSPWVPRLTVTASRTEALARKGAARATGSLPPWTSGRWGGRNDPPMPLEKSDHLMVARKPGNSGGATQVTT